MDDITVGQVLRRYLLGGTLLAIALMSVITLGGLPAMAWFYGASSIPLALVGFGLPNLTGAAGAALARDNPLGWRMTAAAASTFLASMVILIAASWQHPRAESLMIVPFCVLMSQAGGACDWFLSRDLLSRRKPRARRNSIVICAAAIAIVSAGFAFHVSHDEPSEYLL